MPGSAFTIPQISDALTHAWLPGHRGTYSKPMSPLSAAHAEEPPSAQHGSQAPNERATTSDRELLVSLRAREAGAATALHTRARSIIAQTVNRLLGKRDAEVEDVAQLAFIELLRTIDNLGEFGALDAWVRIVSARVVYRHIKRRQHERRLSRALPLAAVTTANAATPRDFVLHDALHRVRRHLSRLDANRTFTFLLHDVYGYDMLEVARMTGVSVAAARTRLSRGRREVRKRIDSDPELANLASELRCGQRAS